MLCLISKDIFTSIIDPDITCHGDLQAWRMGEHYIVPAAAAVENSSSSWKLVIRFQCGDPRLGTFYLLLVSFFVCVFVVNKCQKLLVEARCGN